MDLFRKNININLERAADKKIRLASKSIRSVELMRYIFERSNQFQGIMAYHGAEAVFLSQSGFDDILLGYPVVERQLLKAIAEEVRKGKQICLMVDSLEHLDLIQTVAKQMEVVLPICLDIDLSDNYPALHFGVWRSSLMHFSDVGKIVAAIQQRPSLRLDGIMGYEAQIAGVADQEKNNSLKNNIIQWLKKRSLSSVRNRRTQIVHYIQEQGFELRFVNGGGTGSLESTRKEVLVSEVTVGSGFYNAHYFDNFKNFNLEAALFYAIPIVRKPQSDIYTCHGGGFIASGAIDAIKAPIVHLPASGYLDALEGAGEVQTPIRFKKLTEPLQIGDPIFMRYAKAGEMCERFNKLILLDKNGLKNCLTYRGLGLNFG